MVAFTLNASLWISIYVPHLYCEFYQADAIVFWTLLIAQGTPIKPPPRDCLTMSSQI